MSELSPRQRRGRERIERLIAVIAPALDLVLEAGDRVSRALGPDDRDHYPVRVSGVPALPESERAETGRATE